MSRARLRLGAVALALALAAPAAALVPGDAGAAPAPGLLACSGHVVRRPTTFVIACADGYTRLRAIHWTSWGAATATATATFGLNPCTPYCAASAIRYYPHATVRLGDPLRTSHGILYSTMVVHYVQAGKDRTFTFSWKGDPGFTARTAPRRASS